MYLLYVFVYQVRVRVVLSHLCMYVCTPIFYFFKDSIYTVDRPKCGD